MREAKRLRFITINPAYDLEGSIKAPRVVHRPALPLSRLPELQERIDTYKGRALTRLTVKLSLHVFVRSSELRFARWSEFDLKRGTWEIPDTRPALDGVPFSTRGTKMAGDIHLVPLSPQAVALLEQIHALTGKFDLVFAGDAKVGGIQVSTSDRLLPVATAALGGYLPIPYGGDDRQRSNSGGLPFRMRL